jgi:hypothetical protein
MVAVGLAYATAAGRAATWKAANGPLRTRWAKDVSPANALPEYPRPQMVRGQWRSLNGLWDYRIQAEPEHKIEAAAGQILVPYPVESELSGVMKPARHIRYERSFNVPEGWQGQRIWLHFGAVDWEATVSVNGTSLGVHRGGYDGFSFDITDALKSGSNVLAVDVFDPSDDGDQPRGKQVNNPEGIFYTPCTGIWQTVWLEPAPASSIRDLVITPDVDAGCVRVKALTSGDMTGLTLKAVALAGSSTAGRAEGAAGDELVIAVPNAKLWGPGHPYLYGLRVSLTEKKRTVDTVKSYFGMRKIEVKPDEAGVPRILLNGEFVFQVGPLDQGFWPDGIYTAPTDAALKWDITATQKLGFNMTRKHVKVEPDRWYYHCDKAGLLVWQDMPSGDNKTDEAKAQHEVELRRMIEGRRNHPSIITWVVFNEGWGQFDTERITAWVKEMDPTRLANNASGWTDKGAGDMFDTHAYPAPSSPKAVPPRAIVVGEFGGLGLPIQGHIWKEKAGWGYRGLQNGAELTREYQRLFRKVWALEKDPGISAVVYTQITDVESEQNGLYTYDREILKAPLKAIRDANTGHIPPPPVTTVVVPSAKQQASMWRYTFETPDSRWTSVGFDDSAWKQGPSGFGRIGTPGAVIGTEWTGSDIWIRKTFTLPDPLPKNLLLSLHHDEDVNVWLNGEQAGHMMGYSTDYEETTIQEAARKTLHPGVNTIGIHCHNETGGQYVDAGLVSIEG